MQVYSGRLILELGLCSLDLALKPSFHSTPLNLKTSFYLLYGLYTSLLPLVVV